MAPKVRYIKSAKAAKDVKRLGGGFRLRYGITPPGTVPKVGLIQIISGEDIERLSKLGVRYRVIARADGKEFVQDAVRERDVNYVIEKLLGAQKKLITMRDDSRKSSRTRNGDGGGGDPVGIFHRLVDEDKMSDCILRIRDSFFRGEKECTICQKERCNIYDFFILVRFYFIYIGIMDKNISRLAFCRYLEEAVYGGYEGVNVRSFNNYSNKDVYQNFDKFLSNNKNIRFNERPQLPRPKTENFLLAPFQEIGWKFQHSPYFRELRKEVKKVQSFIL